MSTETIDITIEKLNISNMHNKSDEEDMLIDIDNNITVTNKCDLINLVWEYSYLSKMLVEKVKSIDIPDLFDRDRNADLPEVNFDSILSGDCNDKVNKILRT